MGGRGLARLVDHVFDNLSDKQSYIAFLLLGIAGIIGSLFILKSAGEGIVFSRQLKENGIETIAIAADYKTKKYSNSDDVVHYMTLKFKTESGEDVSIPTKTGSNYVMAGAVKGNSFAAPKVSIKYLPDDPKKFIFVKDYSAKSSSYISGGFGLLLFLLSLFLVKYGFSSLKDSP